MSNALQSCMGNWQEARTVAIMDKNAPGHLGFQGTSTVSASRRCCITASHTAFL